MGTEESNKSTKPCKNPVVQDETENKLLQPVWYPSMQAYQYSVPTPRPIISSYVAAASSYYYPHIWPNQTFSTSIQYDPSRLNNNLIVSGVQTFSIPLQLDRSRLNDNPIVSGTFNVQKVDSTKTCQGNSQPGSSILKEFRENGNESSVSKNEQDRGAWSATNGSMGSSYEGHDADNGFPSSREQQCNMMAAKRDFTQNGARIENGNADHVNKDPASEQFAVNSTEQNLNSGTGPNISGTLYGPAKLEEDEIRKERKRQLNRESARRSRIRRQQELEELHRITNDLVKQNSSLKDKLMSLSEDCLELTEENNSLEEEITKMYGDDAIADFIAKKPGGGTR